jgi:hypothetical protein
VKAELHSFHCFHSLQKERPYLIKQDKTLFPTYRDELQ